MVTIDISKKYYEQIKKYPLLFFNGVEVPDYKFGGTKLDWEPEALYVFGENRNHFYSSDIRSKTKDILLAYGKTSSQSSEKTSSQSSEKSDCICLDLESFDSKNITHVKAVLNIFLTKFHNNNRDKYCAREFLWMLNSYYIDIRVLSQALDTFDKIYVQPFFWEELKRYSVCLSIPKQRLIQKFLASKGVSKEIYYPQSLEEALKCCYPTIDFSAENLSIFQLVDIAVISGKYKDVVMNKDEQSIENPTNFFMKIRKWLRDSDYEFLDFEKLSDMFRLFRPVVQILLVKRYFHAVRSGYVKFDQALLKSFQVNKYDKLGVYYHCAHEVCKPISLAVPLLCDNILTFINSGHATLQTLNGTLDMAYAQCDINAPKIDFGLKHIVPICNGGIVPNIDEFLGFICYKIVYTLKEGAFTPEAILNNYKRYLNLYGNQKIENVCHKEGVSHANCKDYLNDYQACSKCVSNKFRFLNKYTVKLNPYDDDKDSKRTILQIFSKELFLEEPTHIIPECSVNTPDEVKNKIQSWLKANFEHVSEKTTIMKSGTNVQLEAGWIKKDLNDCYDSLASDFLVPTWCYIEPRRNSFIGEWVLNKETGIDEDFIRRNGIRSSSDVRIQEKEHSIIFPRIVAALNDMLDFKSDENGVYHIPYDEGLLHKLKTYFYTSKEVDNHSSFTENGIGFLIHSNSKYERYCAPKFDNNINLVTKLPFMWCRGKECFGTSLYNQTLSSCKTWKQYTIIHILEILGFPQITSSTGVNEVSELIRSFIGMVNKATYLFKRFRCRECGHVLFPINRSSFNQYNYFECKLPTCGEIGKKIYLSNCHQCKKGLIDSRDSAKCPNGWHICPECLSCCNDSVYERLSSKYILRRLQIPIRIAEKLGHGHNDKNEYFCYKCGGKIATVRDEHSGKIAQICQVCRSVYEL